MDRAVLVVAFAFLPLTGCGTLSGQAAPGTLPGQAAPGTVSGQEAPESCGFPDGTALSYAGRSTTAALGVQEVVGDPMSEDPADIYITRDQFDQGELRGRLVCAIFVNAPGFVEVTVHPADGGRVSELPDPSVSAPPDGISRNDAVDAARDVLSDEDAWKVILVEAGPIGQVLPAGWDIYEWARDFSADLWVWRVFLTHGDRGVDVVIDFVDGSVYGVVESIVN
ncbi:MAG: hypothetical protein ACRDGD_06105 [Candidatus Limnocylindria bacterium]